MPEIVTVDEAMGEPEGDVMWVVALFARDVFFKREVAGDVGAAWADERIEAGNLLVGPEDGGLVKAEALRLLKVLRGNMS